MNPKDNDLMSEWNNLLFKYQNQSNDHMSKLNNALLKIRNGVKSSPDYNADLKNLKDVIKDLIDNYQWYLDNYSWYENYNYQANHQEIISIDDRINKIRDEYNACGAEIKKRKSEMNLIDEQRKSCSILKRVCSSKEREKYKELNKQYDEIYHKYWELFYQKLPKLRLKLEKAEEDERILSQMKNDEAKYKKIKDLDDSFKEFEPSIMTSFIDKLKDLLKKLDDLQYCQEAIKGANDYQIRLGQEWNRFEKRMIHDECRRLYGDDHPGRVLSDNLRKEEWLQRCIKKMTKRIIIELEKIERKIDCIIIDGCNLCFDSRNNFIGIAPTIAVANELSKKYKIIVIFDHTITSRYEEEYLKSRFSPDVHDVCIAPPNKDADSIILNLPDTGVNAYIISNDKYIEYPDKAVQKEDRILHHDIIDNHILIEDLDINLPF